jgi:hypothetical protein
MRNCNPGAAVFALIALAWYCAPAGAQITFGKLEDFQNQSLDGWGQGPAPNVDPNPSFLVSTGGPAGAGDAFLENPSSGSAGVGGRQVVLNSTNWIGNFTAAGVTRMDVRMANLGTTALSMRVGIEDQAGARYVSTNAISLAPDGQWHSLSFGLTPDDLSHDRGVDSAAQALATVSSFRFMSASNATFQGDVMASTLGIDNIHAVPEPGAVGFVAGVMGLALRRGRREN